MPLLSEARAAAGHCTEGRAPERAAEAERELEQDLRRLVRGETVPEFCFQPIADLERAVVAGYEALARLPVRAGLPPDVCLQAANRFGLRLELEGLLAKGALEARRALPANNFLCVNVSPSFLVSAGGEQLFAAQRDLSRVVVEITEDQSIADYESIRSRMAAIRAKGGIVAIDDAGAGYASLKHILELRPGFIKLDRNFVSHCDTDRAKATLIETMGVAANRMDAWIIAEGVETAGELAELVRLGVPLAQGYYLGRPAVSMADLLPGARQDLKTRTLHRAMEDNLLLHAEVCSTATSREQAETLLQGLPPGSVVVVIDGWKRPLALFEQHPLCGLRVLTMFLRCRASSDLRETLQRALTRPQEARFDPVVLIDDQGLLQGIARVDRMMAGVLQDTDLPARQGAGNRERHSCP